VINSVPTGDSPGGDGTASPEESELTPQMEMHGVERSEVVDLLEASGSKVLAVLDDESAGREWLSFLYIAQKDEHDQRPAGGRRRLRWPRRARRAPATTGTG
jgi:hypothetical protein